jgi:hypothetical protein
MAQHESTIPLSILRSGASLLVAGLTLGFIVPAAAFPRLAVVAHTQLMIEDTMTLVNGLLLQSRPFGGVDSPRLVDTMSWLQQQTVRWGVAAIWPVLLSEVANAWWGTRGVLSLAAENANVPADYAKPWQSWTVDFTHMALSPMLWASVSASVDASEMQMR